MYLDKTKVVCCSLLLVVLAATCIGLITYVVIISQKISGSNEVNSDNTSEITPVTTEDTRKEQWEFNLRLPTDVLPNSYSIYLHPNLETAGFKGNSSVIVSVANGYNRSQIWLHSKYLNITSVKVYRLEGSSSSVLDSWFDFYVKHDFLVVHLPSIIQPGDYSLDFEFKGNLTSDPVDGFYRSFYMSGSSRTKSNKRYLATTQMEATYAREAFPCFDEPGFKANFSVTIVRPENYIALSNMPVLSEVAGPSSGLYEVSFKPTIRMTTYALAFIVCDYPSLQNVTKSGVLFQTLAPAAELNATSYGLNIGTQILDFYEDLFQIPYPLPKQDMIAIPDFDEGAMENWGLVTYRETLLLFDERENSEDDLHETAEVIAHELSHMWFGNLVTMRWWDDLWLNEGFATFISFKGVAHVEPTWDMDSVFLIHETYVAMRIDFPNASHAIVQEVDDPVFVKGMFDAISYQKGTSVLRMLEQAIGPEVFRKGVNSYLSKNQYNNTVSQDLYDELQNALDSTTSAGSNFNLTRYMLTWTYQIGYPVVSVTQENNSYVIKQNVFYESPEEKEYFENYFQTATKWDIYITYKYHPVDVSTNITSSNSTWFFINDTQKIIPKFPGKTLKLNFKQYGYYITNYDTETWKELTDLLVKNNTEFVPCDRANLVEDAFSLSRSGLLNYTLTLNLSTYLKNEREYAPWKAGIYAMAEISDLIWNQPFYQMYKKYVLNLLNDTYYDFGWTDTGVHLKKMLRTSILDLACKLDHDDCLNEAVNKFMLWIKDNTTFIPPNIKVQVYNYGMTYAGTEKVWDIMFERYKHEQIAAERIRILNALGMITEPWLIQRFIGYLISGEYVHFQDMMDVLNGITANPVGRTVLWDYIRTEWNNLLTAFPTATMDFEKIVLSVAAYFNTEVKLQELTDFYSRIEVIEDSVSFREKIVETVERNIFWLERSKHDIQDWLLSAGYTTI